MKKTTKSSDINKTEAVRIFSYKMTDDTGFAPNPFKGFMTLATCKPYIRKTKKKGDWIAGFTSVTLNKDKVGEERLIFLMEVTENPVKYSDYWDLKEYQVKKANMNSKNVEDKTGDNIYKPISNSTTGFKQIGTKFHNEVEIIENDLFGENVLISQNFYYFGSKPVHIPKKFRPNVPKGSTPYGVITDENGNGNEFIKYIQLNFKKGIINMPHIWPKENNNINKGKSCK